MPPLFEVAIVETPSHDAAARGDTEKLILAPTPVLATDSQGAIVAACMKSEPIGDVTRFVVTVRPFKAG